MTANEKVKTVRCSRCRTPMRRSLFGYICERCTGGWWFKPQAANAEFEEQWAKLKKLTSTSGEDVDALSAALEWLAESQVSEGES